MAVSVAFRCYDFESFRGYLKNKDFHFFCSKIPCEIAIVPFKIARYVIGDDAIIAVRINTTGNGINNNYRPEGPKS
jgi:hypothetical protein